ncbi:hypothetical protein FISHEDRAFT_59736 [Fistulina hepatica ATCC 64428]|uniref:Uncharacterized protein n=1 Tax=Fistulina hepatica ATCC 64428 TaxID=1128425 RepID=A0A0D7A9H7_9AGAR|nr:hypothetical protein FISHEDRAFT_59736 [Fistulina hepatica ATCC 64428]
MSSPVAVASSRADSFNSTFSLLTAFSHRDKLDIAGDNSNVISPTRRTGRNRSSTLLVGLSRPGPASEWLDAGVNDSLGISPSTLPMIATELPHEPSDSSDECASASGSDDSQSDDADFHYDVADNRTDEMAVELNVDPAFVEEAPTPRKGRRGGPDRLGVEGHVLRKTRRTVRAHTDGF